MNQNTNLYTPRKILVTGGAGFIGSHYIRYVLNNSPDVTVVNLDLLTYASWLTCFSVKPNMRRYHFVQGDICDRYLIDTLLRQYDIDTIVHFAAESHVDRSINEPAVFVHTNVLGTFTLLEAAKQYWLLEKKYTSQQCRFHHISTDEVYGSLRENEPPFTETTAYAPRSPYSASKAASDHLVQAYFATYQLPITLTNCSNNYGPYQHAEKFIPTIILACFDGRTIPVYGDGLHRRDWLYVEDHCAAVQAVISKGIVGESYNIGGENEVANIVLVMKICDMMDQFRLRKKPHRSLIRYVVDRPGHDWRYAMDISKIKAEGIWLPSKGFDTTLQKTIEFYCCHDTLMSL
jgi:dTDP-glucose 4,6-dehydratase